MYIRVIREYVKAIAGVGLQEETELLATFHIPAVYVPRQGDTFNTQLGDADGKIYNKFQPQRYTAKRVDWYYVGVEVDHVDIIVA